MLRRFESRVMEVGCYTMELYCDQKGRHPHDEFPHEFTGETRAVCKRQAERSGWRFHKTGHVSCPHCYRLPPVRIDEEVRNNE
jgi:hypothetical protein